MMLILALIASILAAIAVRRWIARRLARNAAEDARQQVAHGEIVRLPIGATPDALREQFHGGEVPHV